MAKSVCFLSPAVAVSESEQIPWPPGACCPDPRRLRGQTLLVYQVTAFSQSKHVPLHPSKLLLDTVSHSSITPDFQLICCYSFPHCISCPALICILQKKVYVEFCVVLFSACKGIPFKNKISVSISRFNLCFKRCCYNNSL